MSTSLLEELEKLLSETNHEKQRLNFICETVWNVLNPPGTEKNGLFKFEKKVKTQQSPRVSEENTNMSSSLGESLESVTKLIALGKLVRDTTKFEKKKIVNPISNFCHTSLPWKEKLETATQVARNKRASSYCKGFDKEVKRDNIDHKQNVKKTDFHPDKTSSSLKKTLSSRPEKMKHEVNSDFTCHNKNSPEVSLNTDFHSALSKEYTHLCSNSLSNLVKTLKMPEDLRCVLKHYYYFEKHKENVSSLENSPKPSLQTFRERFQNVVSVLPNQFLYPLVMGARRGA